MNHLSDNPRVNTARLRKNAPPWLQRLADYWTLTNPEVNFLVLVSTLVGFYLASHGPLDFGRLFHTLMGTLLVASGTATLNEFMERKWDARMRRTAPCLLGDWLRPRRSGSESCYRRLGAGSCGCSRTH